MCIDAKGMHFFRCKVFLLFFPSVNITEANGCLLKEKGGDGLSRDEMEAKQGRLQIAVGKGKGVARWFWRKEGEGLRTRKEFQQI